jgi:hypothetical protein
VSLLARGYLLVSMHVGRVEVARCGLGGMPTEVVEYWELIHGNSTHTELSEQTPSREAHINATLPKQKPTPTTKHHHHAISLLQPLAATRPYRLQGRDPKRLLPESTSLLEPLVASLLAPGMVEDPRQGAASRSRLAAASPGPAEMLDAGRRAVSRVEFQHVRDASLRQRRR